MRPLGTLITADWDKYLREIRRRSTLRTGTDAVLSERGGDLETLEVVAPIVRKRFDRLSYLELRHMLGAKHSNLEAGWFGRLTGSGKGVHELMHNDSLRRDVTRLLASRGQNSRRGKGMPVPSVYDPSLHP